MMYVATEDATLSPPRKLVEKKKRGKAKPASTGTSHSGITELSQCQYVALVLVDAPSDAEVPPPRAPTSKAKGKGKGKAQQPTTVDVIDSDDGGAFILIMKLTGMMFIET